MLDRSMEEQRLPALIPESLLVSTSRNSTSHHESSTTSSCTTVLSNPNQPQAPSSSSSRSPTQHHLQRVRPLSQNYTQTPRFRCLFLLVLCLQNLTLIASRSIPQTSLRPSSQHAEVLQSDSYEHHVLQFAQNGPSVDERLMNDLEDLSLHNIHKSGLRTKRSSGFENNPTLWPNATIPYVFKEPFSTRYRKQVVKAIVLLEKKSCVRFVPKTSADEYFIIFTVSPSSCSSNVGLKTYLRGRQKVYLTKLCLKNRGVILHELTHVLGFYHEHQRPDRDNYITILMDNVKSKLTHQFQKLEFDTYGMEYDFGSIMHYSLYQFSRGGDLKTMELLSNVSTSVEFIGRQHSLSRGDFQRLNRMYNCPARDAARPTTTATPTTIPVTTPTRSNNLHGGITVTSVPSAPPTTATPSAPPTTATPSAPPATATPRAPPSTATPSAPPTTATPNAPPTTATPSAPPTTATPSAPPTTATPNAPPTTATPSAPPTTATPSSPSTTRSVTTTPITSPTTRLTDNYIYSGGRVALRFALNKIGSQAQHRLWLKCTEQHCSLDSCISNSSDIMTTCPYSFFTLHKISSTNGTHRVRVGDEMVLEFMPPSGHPLAGRTLYVSCNPALQSCAISPNCTTEQERLTNPYCESNILKVKADGKSDGDLVTSMDIIGFEFRLMARQTFFKDQCALGCNHQTLQCLKERCIFIPNFLERPLQQQQQQPTMRCGKDMFQIQKAELL